MISSSRKLTSLILLLGVLSYTAQSARVQCNAKSRPAIETCYNDPYTPTCGYYTKDCPFSICASPQSSPCYACADPTILYYETGDCKPQQSVYTCDAGMCDIDNSPDLYFDQNYYLPTCGIPKKCPATGKCGKTISNVCKSCANANYPFYQDGPCEFDKTYCPATRPTSCPASTANVCAAFIDHDNNTHYVNVTSGCQACMNKNIAYYTKGSCGAPEKNQTYCLPNSLVVPCASSNNPVCGFYRDAEGILQHKIMQSPCFACNDKTILYHTPGPCVFYCDRNPWVVYDCAGGLSPICGTYKQNGVTKKVSLRNSCLGCYGVNYDLVSYTEGLCPGDNGILCENNGGAFLEGLLNPVCGLTRLDCTSSSCRKTYADPYTACGSSGVVKYIPGPCPGDYGVPCTEFRPDKGALFSYDKVCGYTKKNCTSASCRANYDNQMLACKKSTVLYFTKGPC